jgi:hypothetical protein
MKRPFTLAADLICRIWHDDGGAILPGEWLVIASLLAAGVVPPVVTIRQGLNDPMIEFSNAVRSLDPSFTISGNRLHDGSRIRPLSDPDETGASRFKRVGRSRVDEFERSPQTKSPASPDVVPATQQGAIKSDDAAKPLTPAQFERTPPDTAGAQKLERIQGVRKSDRRRDPRNALAWTAASGYLRGTHTPDGRAWSTKEKSKIVEPEGKKQDKPAKPADDSK